MAARNKQRDVIHIISQDHRHPNQSKRGPGACMAILYDGSHDLGKIGCEMSHKYSSVMAIARLASRPPKVKQLLKEMYDGGWNLVSLGGAGQGLAAWSSSSGEWWTRPLVRTLARLDLQTPNSGQSRRASHLHYLRLSLVGQLSRISTSRLDRGAVTSLKRTKKGRLPSPRKERCVSSSLWETC
jgi:hypothetical protein